MYIMITSKCNMRCSHCCYPFVSAEGEHMLLSTFETLLKKWGNISHRVYGYILLGGGEPTLHPDFWKIIEHSGLYSIPWLVTNGSNTEYSLELCERAKRGQMRAVLSLDEWHSKIDDKVVRAFSDGLNCVTDFLDKGVRTFNSYNASDEREIRMTILPIKSGKANSFDKKTLIDGCACDSLNVRPNGDIYECGCDNSLKIGSIDEGLLIKNPSLCGKGSLINFHQKKFFLRLMSEVEF